MQNRICQIKQGNKGIQIEDLPIFPELLGVSIDDILSAGTSLAPVNNHKSNYSIAFSKDPAEWESYIKRDDKLILNPDEYDKTAIDYALETDNYPFLKYLMDHNYIWFVGDKKEEYYLGFGADTSIEKRAIGYTDILDVRLKEQDDFRFKMISLAIRDKDFSMLDRLHAREAPLLYKINPIQHWTLRDTELPSSPNVEQMVESIASSENTALAYFFDEFEIEAIRNVTKNTYVFPYAGDVLDHLIKSRRIAESKRFPERAIVHNQKVQKHLRKLVDKNIASSKELYENSGSKFYDKSIINKEAWSNYAFYPEIGFVAYYMPFFAQNATGFITNVINVTASSKDSEVQFLIDELKDTYKAFKRFSEKKEA